MNTTLPGIELPPPLQPATTTPPAWRELCKTVKLVTPDGRDTWNLVVQPINHFETQLALDNIGRLNDPSISLYSAADHRPEQVAARLWKQSGVTVAALLKSSPFWLDALTRPRLLVNPDSHRNTWCATGWPIFALRRSAPPLL